MALLPLKYDSGLENSCTIAHSNSNRTQGKMYKECFMYSNFDYCHSHFFCSEELPVKHCGSVK